MNTTQTTTTTINTTNQYKMSATSARGAMGATNASYYTPQIHSSNASFRSDISKIKSFITQKSMEPTPESIAKAEEKRRREAILATIPKTYASHPPPPMGPPRERPASIKEDFRKVKGMFTHHDDASSTYSGKTMTSDGSSIMSDASTTHEREHRRPSWFSRMNEMGNRRQRIGSAAYGIH